MRRLVDSNVVSNVGKVTVELKSIVDREKGLDSESESDCQHDYPLQATG